MIVFGIILLAALVFPVQASATNHAATPPPMRIAIAAPVRSGDAWLYRIRVLCAGAPILLVADEQTTGKTQLEVDGHITEIVGGAGRIGAQPFGHTVVTLELADLTPNEGVVIRSFGYRHEFTVISHFAVLKLAARVALITGMFYAFLFLMAVLAGVFALVLRERTNLWYAGWTLAILAINAGRDGFYGIDSAAYWLTAGGLVAAIIALLGFVESYLSLRREAPPLFWSVFGVSGLALSGLLCGVTFLHYPPGIAIFAVFAVLGAMLVAAALRWRAGFGPAATLFGGVVMTWVIITFELMLELAHIAIPWLRNWGLQAGCASAVAFFAGAIIQRQAYVHGQRERREAELRRSALEALHDPLTALLNRRGLDAWVQQAPQRVAAVLFIDIDGFKSVNDRGGHAAGDDVLQLISRILRGAVRECDAVARVGGDEFVVAFAGEHPRAQIEEVRMRIAATIAALQPLGPGDTTRIGASIGIGFAGGAVTIDEAVRAADADAYRVKFANRARAAMLLAGGNETA